MIEMREKAIRLALDAHEGVRNQFSGEPYILHALRVMHAVEEAGGDEIAQAGAVLHDVPEDTHYTLSQIESWFGAEVAETVGAVTKRHGETYADRIARAAAHPRGRLVKIADLRDNMRPGGKESLYERYRKALRLLEA